MFRSSSSHTIDPKGRVIIPARFRPVLKAQKTYGVMVTNMDGCLYGYTYREWEEVEAKILSHKTSNMARFRRFFLGNSVDCICDRQDRILIPKGLRKYAGLTKDIVLVGNLDRFEVWDKTKWEETNVEAEQDIQTEEIRKEISSLGL